MPAPSCDWESRTCAIDKQAGIGLLSLQKVEAAAASHLGRNVTAVRYCTRDGNLFQATALVVSACGVA
jgi:hypothetical protein